MIYILITISGISLLLNLLVFLGVLSLIKIAFALILSTEKSEGLKRELKASITKSKTSSAIVNYMTREDEEIQEEISKLDPLTQKILNGEDVTAHQQAEFIKDQQYLQSIKEETERINK